MLKIDKKSIEILVTYLETINFDNNKFLDTQSESYRKGVKDGIKSTIGILRACNDYRLVKKMIIDVYKKETKKG